MSTNHSFKYDHKDLNSSSSECEDEDPSSTSEDSTTFNSEDEDTDRDSTSASEGDNNALDVRNLTSSDGDPENVSFGFLSSVEEIVADRSRTNNETSEEGSVSESSADLTVELEEHAVFSSCEFDVCRNIVIFGFSSLCYFCRNLFCGDHFMTDEHECQFSHAMARLRISIEE